jgi:hypothetical protein
LQGGVIATVVDVAAGRVAHHVAGEEDGSDCGHAHPLPDTRHGGSCARDRPTAAPRQVADLRAGRRVRRGPRRACRDLDAGVLDSHGSARPGRPGLDGALTSAQRTPSPRIRNAAEACSTTGRASTTARCHDGGAVLPSRTMPCQVRPRERRASRVCITCFGTGRIKSRRWTERCSPCSGHGSVRVPAS